MNPVAFDSRHRRLDTSESSHFNHESMRAIGIVIIALIFIWIGWKREAPVLHPVPEERQALVDSSELEILFAPYRDSPVQPFLSPDAAAAAAWVDSVLTTLSLNEKIGQLLIVHMDPAGLTGINDAVEAVARFSVGGFLVPRLMGPKEVAAETRRLQQASTVPLFFAADYERGVGRFSNSFTELPSNMALGATRNPVLSEAAGRLTAIESRAIGVNLLFAPVVDVNNNPNNPIINTRSYGERPALVGEMASAFIRGASRYGVHTTAKHFPGHGNTTVDSHVRMGRVPGTRADLNCTELAPYRAILAGNSKPAAIMTAHLWISAIDEEPIPATLSRRAMHNLLRDSLGFEGLVVTDDIGMGGLSERYGYEERIIGALRAGVDLILTPRDIRQAKDAIRGAVNSGRMTEAQIDASVRRILAAKAAIGLHVDRFFHDAALEFLQREARGEHIAQAIADRSITVLKRSDLKGIVDGRKIALVQAATNDQLESIQEAMKLMAERMGEGQSISDLRVPQRPSSAESHRIEASALEADVVVLALYLRIQAGQERIALRPEQKMIIDRITASKKPVVLVTFGNPYVATDFAGAEAVVIAYDQTLNSVRAVTDVMAGYLSPTGVLPISVGSYAFGSGMTAHAEG